MHAMVRHVTKFDDKDGVSATTTILSMFMTSRQSTISMQVLFDLMIAGQGQHRRHCRVEAFRIEVSGSIGQSVVRATSDIHMP